MAAFGVPAEDDDGNAAAASAPKRADPLETDAARQMIQALRDAAMEGEDALSKAFADMPKGPVKAAVWKAHGAALKEAAAQVAA